ncbi:MAG: DUF1127 domain-containing protein [Mesorhizobium sp.]|nr:MAG: DUF1127 domain-containing protein [Mesorhizobium sp.]TIT79504.1 MAG: DUF1127 domain-containing protein [Mesorhizobium sp.]
MRGARHFETRFPSRYRGGTVPFGGSSPWAEIYPTSETFPNSFRSISGLSAGEGRDCINISGRFDMTTSVKSLPPYARPHAWRHWSSSGVGRVLGKLVGWCQDEVFRIAAIEELNRLNDHYLEDVGIDRSDIGPIVDATVKRLRESRRKA